MEEEEEEEEEGELGREKRGRRTTSSKRGEKEKEKEEEEEEEEMRGEAKRLKLTTQDLEIFISIENRNAIFSILYQLSYRSITALCFTSTTIRKYCLKNLDDSFWRAAWLSDMNHFFDITMTDKTTGRILLVGERTAPSRSLICTPSTLVR